jgi:ferredoxin
MASIKYGVKKLKVPDGDAVKSVCKDLGVFFSCEQGICGACRVDVKKGIENLGEMNQAESEWGLRGNERLMCQCKIKEGEIDIETPSV